MNIQYERIKGKTSRQSISMTIAKTLKIIVSVHKQKLILSYTKDIKDIKDIIISCKITWEHDFSCKITSGSSRGHFTAIAQTIMNGSVLIS